MACQCTESGDTNHTSRKRPPRCMRTATERSSMAIGRSLCTLTQGGCTSSVGLGTAARALPRTSVSAITRVMKLRTSHVMAVSRRREAPSCTRPAIKREREVPWVSKHACVLFYRDLLEMQVSGSQALSLDPVSSSQLVAAFKTT